jgi:hypothetical protein
MLSARLSSPKSALKRREVVGIALLLVSLLTIFFWPAIFTGRVLLPVDSIFEVDPLWQPLAPEGFTEPGNPLIADQIYQFYPWKRLAVGSLAEGTVPLWNPYINSGQPFLANGQSAVFSPFNLFSYLFPLNVSFVVITLVRFFVAGLFTFLFTREVGISRVGATFAALAFTFSEPMVVWLGHPLSSILVLLPALLFLTERSLTRQSGLYTFALGLIIGAQFLGGHPETSFHVMLTWFAYALYRAVALNGWRPARLIGPGLKIVAAVAVGFGLAAVQLLPFVDFTLSSNIFSSRANLAQGSGLTISDLFFNWHDWPIIITALLPRFYGTPLDNSYWYPYRNYSEHSLYCGVLPLALALVAAFYAGKDWLSKRKRGNAPGPGKAGDLEPPRYFFVALAIVMLGIALRLPLFEIVHHLPIFNLVVNERFRMILPLVVAVLAGMGLDRIVADLSRSPQGKRAEGLRTLVVVLVAFALLSLLAILVASVGFRVFEDQFMERGREFMRSLQGHPLHREPLETYYDLVDVRHQKKLALYSPSNVVMYLPVLIGLGAVVLYRRLAASSRRVSVLSGFALLATVIDLFAVGMPYNPTVEPEQIFPSLPSLQVLPQDAEAYRIIALGPVLRPNSNMVFQLSDARGYDAIIPRRYTELLGRVEGAYYSPPHFFFTHADSPLLDLLNVKYVLADREVGGRWEQVYGDADGIRVYRNKDVLPRVFIVYRAEFVNSPADSLARLVDPDFDWREAVVLEGEPPTWLALPGTPPSTRLSSSQAAPGRASIVNYQLNEVQVEVQNPADGFLVMTDGYAPGWKVRFDSSTAHARDGQKGKIYIADHAFRAVPLPAGRHRLTFVYEPASYRIGALISLLTIGTVTILTVAILWIGRRRHHQAKSQ